MNLEQFKYFVLKRMDDEKLTIKDIAEGTGLHRRTIEGWLNNNRKGGYFFPFYDSVNRVVEFLGYEIVLRRKK